MAVLILFAGAASAASVEEAGPATIPSLPEPARAAAPGVETGLQFEAALAPTAEPAAAPTAGATLRTVAAAPETAAAEASFDGELRRMRADPSVLFDDDRQPIWRLRSFVGTARSRRRTIDAMVDQLRRRSDELKRRPSLRYDVVVLGGGAHAAVYAMTLRRSNPALKVLVVESGETPAALFAALGDAMALNSPTVKPTGADANRFPEHPLRMDDFKDLMQREFPTFEHAQALAASQLYLSGVDVMLDARPEAARPTREGWRVEGLPTDLGARELVVATGPGVPEPGFTDAASVRLVESERARVVASGFEALGIEYFEDAIRHFGRAGKNARKYDGKTVAVIGSGDSGNNVVEMLLGASMPGGNGPYRFHKRGFKARRVLWFGQEARDENEFFFNNKGRYSYDGGLMHYFPRTSGRRPWLARRKGLQPVAAWAIRVRKEGDGYVIADEKGRERRVDHVIVAAGYRTRIHELFPGMPDLSRRGVSYHNLPYGFSSVTGDVTLANSLFDGAYRPVPQILRDRRVALRWKDGIYLVGPAAQGRLLVDDDDARSGSQADRLKLRIKTLTGSKNSLEHMLPRTQAFAREHARRLSAQTKP